MPSPPRSHGFLAPAAIFAVVACGACDKDPAPGSAKTSSAGPTATPTPAASTAPAAPARPTKPQLAVDDAAAFVAGDRLDFAAPDVKGRLAGALGDKPVEGETIVVNAARDAKLPKVVAVFAALAAKKAKAVELHTPRRDRSTAEVVFPLDAKAADCAAVGYIAKDGAISVWPASGATAERFSRGMAGPDLTRGSEGARKRVLACDAPTWFVSADDSVTWGLAFDLVLAVSGNEDGGAPLGKPRSAALLLETPVPGRKVEVR